VHARPVAAAADVGRPWSPVVESAPSAAAVATEPTLWRPA
jgi:hypothetical protein